MFSVFIETNLSIFSFTAFEFYVMFRNAFSIPKLWNILLYFFPLISWVFSSELIVARVRYRDLAVCFFPNCSRHPSAICLDIADPAFFSSNVTYHFCYILLSFQIYKIWVSFWTICLFVSSIFFFSCARRVLFYLCNELQYMMEGVALHSFSRIWYFLGRPYKILF